MTDNNFVKCVAIGDGYVGKTSLLMRLCDKEYDNKDYIPTIFDNHSISPMYNGQPHQILFVDTAGQEEYAMLRKQVYESANIFLVCFSIANTDSFLNITELWLPEIEDCPRTCKLLIGTKSDLRNDPETIDKLNAAGQFFVTKTSAENFAKSHNMRYIECSSTTEENIPEILKTILDLNSQIVQESKKNLLSNPCLCVNPLLQLAKRAFCCKTNYL